MYEIPSCLRETPGLELLVMARAPAAADPCTMEMAASSDSDCTNTPPALGISAAMYAVNSFWGVIG